MGVQRPLGALVIRALQPGQVARPEGLPIVRQPSYKDAAITACDAGLPEPYATD